MRLCDPELWSRISDDPMILSSGGDLLHAIAGQGLGFGKAAVAVEEYRRFIYLRATAQPPIVPSPFIRRIWQQHRESIGDEPGFGRAGTTDLKTLVVADDLPPWDEHDYELTQVLYAEAFGCKPHPRVWPSRAALKYGWFVVAMSAATGLGAALVLGSGEYRYLSAGLIILGVLPLFWWLAMGPWNLSSDIGAHARIGGD